MSTASEMNAPVDTLGHRVGEWALHALHNGPRAVHDLL